MSVLQNDTYAASYAIPGGVTAGSTITLTVTAPDGTVSTPAVVVGATSTASIVPTQTGTYLLVWRSTGNVIDVLQDQFTAIAPSLMLMSLSDLKDQLNISVTDATSTPKLTRFLASAKDVIEFITGPIMPPPASTSTTTVSDASATVTLTRTGNTVAMTAVVNSTGGASHVMTIPAGYRSDGVAYVYGAISGANYAAAGWGVTGNPAQFAVGSSYPSAQTVTTIWFTPDPAPAGAQSRVDTFDGGGRSVVLPLRWVRSITSVTETVGSITYTLTEQPLTSSPVDAYGYTWDRVTHKITRRVTGVDTPFMPGRGNIIVTYVPGMLSIPQVLQDACGELIRHWWDHGQVAYGAPFMPGDDGEIAVTDVMGYAIPNRVVQMCQPYAKGGSAL